MHKILLNSLVVTSFLIAPFAVIAMPESKDGIIASVEFCAELWLLMNLLILCFQFQKVAKLDRGMILITASMVCLFCADSIYSMQIVGLIEEYSILVDCLYSGFAGFLLAFLLRKLSVFQRRFTEWGWIFLAAFLVDSILSYSFLLEPYYRLSFDSLPLKINGTLYMVLTIFIFSLIFPFAFRVAERKTFWFLNFIILFLTADFAIRYQGAFVSMSAFSWAEFAWCCSFMGLAWLLHLSKNRQELFMSQPYVLAPFVSIRSLLTLSICGVNSLFLIGILWLKTYSPDTAIDLAGILLLLFLFWTIANEFSLWLAHDLSGTLKNMFKSKEHLVADGVVQFNLEKVATKNQIYEISKILQSYNDLVDRTNEMVDVVLETSRDAAKAKISFQLIHDIRSPLAALEMVVTGLSELSEEKRILIRSSTGRIKDIINNLVRKSEKISTASLANIDSMLGGEFMTVQLLSGLIEVLISEKRMQFRAKIGVEIDSTLDSSSYGIFSEVNTREFMRLLSNLINNAVEALGSKGRVSVSLVQMKDYAVISVADNGCGIPAKILCNLGQQGETYGKEGGFGLGLYHARTSIESWGGYLQIDSTEDLGTKINLMIPLAQAPTWFVERLNVLPNSKIIVLDDDVSIHMIWEGRLKQIGVNSAGIEVLHFSTPDQLVTWVKENENELIRTTFLVDYELIGFEQVGLSLIEDLGIQSQSILVTSHYEEASIRAWCQRLGVSLIPKGMAGFVPIAVEV